MRERLERDGFVVARGLLQPNELDRLRVSLRKHFQRRWLECDCGKVQQHGAVAAADIGWLFAHPGILAAVREALGREDIVFTGNCDLHRNKLGNWHKDMGRVHGGAIAGDVHDKEECRVVKVGVYLQDQQGEAGCFRASPGTHREESSVPGEVRSVPTQLGDVVIFDVRLTHAGMLPDPVERLIWRGARFASPPGRERAMGRWMKEAWWRMMRKPERMAAFFTFGAPNAYTDEFARNNLRYLSEAGIPDSSLPLPQELVQSLESEGVQVFGGVLGRGTA